LFDSGSERFGIPFLNKTYRGYINGTAEAEKIFGLLKDSTADTIKQDLTDKKIKYTVLKEKKKRLYLSIEYEGKYYHIKVHNFLKEFHLNKIIGHYFSASQARRSWKMAGRFMELGIATPKPLGYIEKRRMGALLSSILVTEYLPEVITLKNMYMLPSNTIDKKLLIIELAKFIALLHNNGIIHGDLKASNIVVKRDHPGGISFYITDLASVKFKEHPSMNDMASDIACIHTSFGSELLPGDRLQFLHHYCKRITSFKMDIRELLKSVQNISAERLKKRERNHAGRYFTNH